MLRACRDLFFGMIFFLYAITPCFGWLTLDSTELESHRHFYNSLPSVEDADKKLSSRRNFPDFLEKAKEIVLSYGLEDSVGLRLIHRHFALNQEQLMVENFEKHFEVPSLITSAHHIASAREKEALPSSWVVSSKEPAVFEFSTDPAVRLGLYRIQNSPNFLTQMSEALKIFELQDLLAVALLKRESLVPETTQAYLEKNYSCSDKSIVQVSLLEEASSYIRTSWSFQPSETTCHCSSHWCVRESGEHRFTRGFHYDG